MCETVEAPVPQPREPHAPVQLPGLQMQLAETRWPWPMAESSDAQAALALAASFVSVAAMAVSSALVAASSAAASRWLVVQPASSDLRPPEGC